MSILTGDNPFADFKKNIQEKITKATPMGDVIKDFQKSDAPQFQGKSDEKKRQMAIAAKLSTEGTDLKHDKNHNGIDDTDENEPKDNIVTKTKKLAKEATDYNKDGKIDKHEQDHADESDTFKKFNKRLKKIEKQEKEEHSKKKVSESINDDDYYEYHKDTKKITRHISGKSPEARKYSNPLTKEHPGKDKDHAVVIGHRAKHLNK